MTTRRRPLREILARQFVLVAALPLLIVVLLWSAVALPDAVDRIERENAQAATLVRSQIEATLAAPQRSLEISGALVAGFAPQSSEVRAVLQQALESTPAFEALYVAGANGVVQDVVAKPSAGVRASDLLGLDLSSRPFYASARERHTLVWSDTFLSPLTGSVTAVLALPMGERLLVADMSLASVARELAQHERLREAIVIVLDGKGRVIAHPQQQLASWQENMSHVPLVKAALQGHPGAGEMEFGGERWLATIARIQPAGWHVLVAQPRALLFAPVQRIAWIVGLAVLAALGVAVLMSLHLAAKEAQRYRGLLAAAQAMVNEGQREVPLDLGSEETHALWERLRELLDRLHDQEQRASAAQRNLQAVLDAATEVAVIATDTQGVIRLFNRGAQKMLGYSAEEMIGSLPDRLHIEAEVLARGEELSALFGRRIAGLDVFVAIARRHGYEVRDWTYVRRDGSQLLVSLAITAVRDASGTLSGFLGIAIDQTQRLRAAELDLARERAEAASHAKSEFLSRVSHELRTPMNAILGYAQLIALDRERALDTVQRERVLRIETAGWHLVKLIDDVLDLSRIESGRVQLSVESVDVGTVLAEAVRLLAPQASEREVSVALTGSMAPPASLVLGDRTRLKQVFVNLLSNAVKYNVRGGSVELSLLDSDPAQLGVQVTDTGRGMDAQQLTRLFEPFDRLGLESTDIEGTGIGLVITKRLVELMNGRIEVLSTPRGGSTFTVFLPRAGEAEAEADDSGGDAAGADDGVRGDVVYVEDNEVNAVLMREVFSLRPGCHLHLASTQAEGRALIERLRPRLVMVDMHLPDGSGVSLLEWLRADPLRRDIPAIVVSADATRAQQDAALAAGARAYLTKPIHVADALQAIDESLAAPS
jgi:PAS domain S-box-containing protein